MINIFGHTDDSELKELLEKGNLDEIQFLYNHSKKKFSEDVFKAVNDFISEKSLYPKITIQAEYTEELQNLDLLKNLSNIKSLRLNLATSLDLTPLNRYLKLNELILTVANGIIDFKEISKQTDLKSLFIKGKVKNIELISHLSKLESFSCLIQGIKSLDYLKPLNNLQELVLFGGEKELSALPEIGRIERLTLMFLRKFQTEDLYPINQMKYLKFLKLQNLPLVNSLNWIENNELEIEIEDLKGLNSSR